MHHRVTALDLLEHLVYLVVGFLRTFLPMGRRRARALPRFGGCHSFIALVEVGRLSTDGLHVDDAGLFWIEVGMAKHLNLDAGTTPT